MEIVTSWVKRMNNNYVIVCAHVSFNSSPIKRVFNKFSLSVNALQKTVKIVFP